MQSRSPLAVSADIVALQRRIERLESMVIGHSPPRVSPHLLLDLYRWLESTSLRGVRSIDEAQLVVNAAIGLDEGGAFEMCRLASDPFAWAVLVRLLRAAQATYPLPALRDAEDHVLSIGRNLLDIQGLGIVGIEDVIVSGTPMQRAARRVFIGPTDSSTPSPSDGPDESPSPEPKRRSRRRAPGTEAEP